MSTRQDLLIELGCEELPAKQLNKQLALLASGLGERLAKAGLLESATAVDTMATPRRLAVRFHGVLDAQTDQAIERRGPAVKVAFDESGQPTRAAEGFARGLGLTVDQLERLETEQGSWLVARVVEKGQALAAVLPGLLEQTVADMAGARSMRWADRQDRFLRPVRWLVVLHGDRALDVELFGLKAGQQTQGHRIHSSGALTLTSAADYEAVLRAAKVMVDPAERRQAIVDQAQALARDEGLVADLPEDLVDENAGLTEWPVAVMGSFDEAFLEVPAEALISSMQNHQKCFALRNAQGALVNRFIAIANIESQDVAAMVAGFERVIRPRLSDARFFWTQDQRQPLANLASRLDDILFQEKLGSLGNKQRRLADLAVHLAPAFGADEASARQAAELCKCDLVTDMVGEFPELQGIMGRYYAQVSGVAESVAQAIESHYQPRHAGDELPGDATGRTLAVADRLDTLVGIFAAGQKPKGSKDPFALRRAALGIVRILEASACPLTLDELVEAAIGSLSSTLEVKDDTRQDVLAFIIERFRSHSADQGIEVNTFQAVAAGKSGSVADFMARARAIQAFASSEQAESLIGANKRASNLLKQAEDLTLGEVTESRLSDPAEQTLYQAVVETEQTLEPLLAEARYSEALAELARLREPVDQFFEGVMVMADAPEIRANRLALLARLRGLIADIADLARLGR